MTMHGDAMSQPLFRDEVLKARRTRWLGGISLAQPLRLWVLTGLAVVRLRSSSACAARRAVPPPGISPALPLRLGGFFFAPQSYRRMVHATC